MNEQNVYKLLQKCSLSQLKTLYRDMKKPKQKGTFGYEFVIYSKLPKLSDFTQYGLEVLCQKENEEKVHTFLFKMGKNGMKAFCESRKVIRGLRAENDDVVEFNIQNIRVCESPKQIQKWLLDYIFNIFSVYIFNKGHTILPAMEYNEWKKGNYGYERLIDMPYLKEYAWNAAINHSINYIKKII